MQQLGQPRRRHPHVPFPLQPVAQLTRSPGHPRLGRGVQQRTQRLKVLTADLGGPSRTRGIGQGLEPAADEPAHGIAHRDRVAFQQVRNLRHRQTPTQQPYALQAPPLITRQTLPGQPPPHIGLLLDRQLHCQDLRHRHHSHQSLYPNRELTSPRRLRARRQHLDDRVRRAHRCPRPPVSQRRRLARRSRVSGRPASPSFTRPKKCGVPTLRDG